MAAMEVGRFDALLDRSSASAIGGVGYHEDLVGGVHWWKKKVQR